MGTRPLCFYRGAPTQCRPLRERCPPASAAGPRWSVPRKQPRVRTTLTSPPQLAAAHLPYAAAFFALTRNSSFLIAMVGPGSRTVERPVNRSHSDYVPVPSGIAPLDAAAPEGERDKREAADDRSEKLCTTHSINEGRNEQRRAEHDIQITGSARDLGAGDYRHCHDQSADQVIGIGHAAVGAQRETGQHKPGADHYRYSE